MCELSDRFATDRTVMARYVKFGFVLDLRNTKLGFYMFECYVSYKGEDVKGRKINVKYGFYG